MAEQGFASPGSLVRPQPHRARRFDAGQSQEVVGPSRPAFTVALAMSPSLPQESQEAVMMIEKVVAVGVMVVLFGLIHYRNTYYRSSWERMTKGLR